MLAARMLAIPTHRAAKTTKRTAGVSESAEVPE